MLTELEALVLYALVVPFLIVLFGIKQRRNPISILRGMKPFFREFEARGPNTISGPGRISAGSRLRVDSLPAAHTIMWFRLFLILVPVAWRVGRWTWRRVRAQAESPR